MDSNERIAEQVGFLLCMIEDYARSGALEEDKEVLEMANEQEMTERFNVWWDEEVEPDDFTKFEHTCGICGCVYQWSADDIAWQYEAYHFMPCGDKWEFLDRVID